MNIFEIAQDYLKSEINILIVIWLMLEMDNCQEEECVVETLYILKYIPFLLVRCDSFDAEGFLLEVKRSLQE